MDVLRMSDFADAPKRTSWGPWRYDAAHQVVEHETLDGIYYPIHEGEKPISAAEKWDIVDHVSSKTWADAETVGWLVLALSEAGA